MFEALYTQPGVIRRHREAPLAAEREKYLEESAARGMARETLLRRARHSRCVAVELQRYPNDRSFTPIEVCTMAQDWASCRRSGQLASNPRGAAEGFRIVALELLRNLGRLRSDRPDDGLAEFTVKLDEFVSAQGEARWQSAATRQAGRWHVRRFLTYLKRRRVDLSEVAPADIDAFYKQVALRWNRSSLQRSASALRRWFEYAAERGWSRSGLAATIETPRLYRDEGLPMGPGLGDCRPDARRSRRRRVVFRIILHDDFRIISDANLVIIQIVSCRRELGARGLTEAAGSGKFPSGGTDDSDLFCFAADLQLNRGLDGSAVGWQGVVRSGTVYCRSRLRGLAGPVGSGVGIAVAGRSSL